MPLVAMRASVRDVFPWSYVDTRKQDDGIAVLKMTYDVCQYTDLFTTSVSRMPRDVG